MKAGVIMGFTSFEYNSYQSYFSWFHIRQNLTYRHGVLAMSRLFLEEISSTRTYIYSRPRTLLYD